MCLNWFQIRPQTCLTCLHRMRMGLCTLNFDEDHFEAVLDAFAAAVEPVTKIGDALTLAPRGTDADLVEAALRHWKEKTKDGENKGPLLIC